MTVAAIFFLAAVTGFGFTCLLVELRAWRSQQRSVSEAIADTEQQMLAWHAYACRAGAQEAQGKITTPREADLVNLTIATIEEYPYVPEVRS
jgi:uncharacterized iron-regulated membrane protein